MVSELLRKVGRELNAVRLERCRDEDALPTDLWRKPVRVPFLTCVAAL